MKKLACVANLDVTQVVSPTSVFYTLAFTHFLDNLSSFGCGVKRRTTRKDGPLIKHGLVEGLPAGV